MMFLRKKGLQFHFLLDNDINTERNSFQHSFKCNHSQYNIFKTYIFHVDNLIRYKFWNLIPFVQKYQSQCSDVSQ